MRKNFLIIQSWPFLEAVNKEEVPDYYNIITNPIGIFLDKFSKI